MQCFNFSYGQFTSIFNSRSLTIQLQKEGLNGVKRVAWNIQKINRVSWIIFVQITVLFVEGLYGVKRVAWNIQKINRVPCLLHPHWDPPKSAKSQNSKNTIFHLTEKKRKQMVPCKSTAE